jgi:hypothetical protein
MFVDMSKRTMFLHLLYIVILAVIFSISGLMIDSGSGDRKYAFTFLTISVALGIICLLTLHRNTKSRTARFSMTSAALLMTGLLIGGIIISKPSFPKKIEILNYVLISVLTVLNLGAAYFFIGVEDTNNNSDY